MKWPQRIQGAEAADRAGHYWVEPDKYGRRILHIVVSTQPAGADDRGIEVNVQAFSLDYIMGYVKRSAIVGLAWSVIYFGWQYGR